MLRPYAIDGEVITTNNRGHLKINWRCPSGNHSFVMGSTPSDHRWRHRAKTGLRRLSTQKSFKNDIEIKSNPISALRYPPGDDASQWIQHDAEQPDRHLPGSVFPLPPVIHLKRDAVR